MMSDHKAGCDGQHGPRVACNRNAAGGVSAAGARPSDARRCPHCGRLNVRASELCDYCARPLAPTHRQYVSGMAFLLNEATSGIMRRLVSDEAADRVIEHYGGELRAAIGDVPQPRPRPAAAPAPVAVPLPRPVVADARPATPVVRRTPPAPPQPPAAPRAPRDWSWLVEQQANLFLFAGAFLTVVAALVYVGYSGQAVDGTLKMMLLVAYTVAFLAAGVLCLRVPRVEAAGRVFFAIGAILVPMNFAAARTIIGDESLNAQTMWLAGSIVTAAFYVSIALLGFGRMYAFGGGVAMVSGAAAACVVAEVPVAWAPPIFLALALVMTSVNVAPSELLRRRIGGALAAESHVVAFGALAVALLMSPFVASEGQRAERWYLFVSFAVFAAYAVVPMLATRERQFGIAALGGAIGGCLAVVFAVDRPVESYVIALAGTALLLGCATSFVTDERVLRRLPDGAVEFVRWTAVAITAAAGLVALEVLQAMASQDSRYVPQTRWFIAAAFGLTAAFYGLDAGVMRRRLGSSGTLASLTGVMAGVAFAVDASAEYYAYALIAGGAIAVAAASWLEPRLPRRFEPIHLRGDAAAFVLALVPAGGVVAAIGIAAEAAGDARAPQTPWFLLGASLAAVAVYGAYVLDRRGFLGGSDRVATYGLGVATVVSALSITYALHANAGYYALASVGGGAVVLAVSALALPRLIGERPQLVEDALVVVHPAGALGALIAILALGGEAGSAAHLASRWMLPGAFLALACLYAFVALASKNRDAEFRQAAGAGCVCVLFGMSMGLVYALDVSPEYYAFAALVPAIGLGALAHVGLPKVAGSALPGGWREGAIAAGRLATTVGVAIGIGAVLAEAGEDTGYAPQSYAFLPLVMLCAAAFFLLDAARERRLESSLVAFVAIAATIVAVPYATRSDAPWYGAAFAAAGVLLAFGLRLWMPSWLDGRARDAVALTSATIGWLAFEPAYADAPRLAALVHVSAAVLYAARAITDTSETTLAALIDAPGGQRVRLAMGWLYASGLTATASYIYMLRSVGPEEGVGAGSLAVPILGVAIAFAVAGAAARWWRREFGIHLYIMSLLAAVASVAMADDSRTLAILLSVYVGIYVAVAVFEDRPLLGVPSALFGFAAVAAWREEASLNAAWIPIAYAIVCVAAYAIAIAVRGRESWSVALRATGAAYGVVAPAVGFVLLGAIDHAGSARDTALYEAATASVAVAGVIALVESRLMKRDWIIAPASAVLLVALLLQIARFNPSNAQAYTAVIGAYLVLLAIVGLSRMKLIPELAGTANYVEALGAATIMLPSFAQSFDGGWRYELILVAETAIFFTIGVGLRRRGLVSASVLSLVLVAGRVLVDAVNALPNWITIMLAGLALLGIGLGILVSRERWSRWQAEVRAWWGEQSPGVRA